MLDIVFELFLDSLKRSDFLVQSEHDFRSLPNQPSRSSSRDSSINFFRIVHRLPGHLTAPFVLDPKQLRIIHILMFASWLKIGWRGWLSWSVAASQACRGSG